MEAGIPEFLSTSRVRHPSFRTASEMIAPRITSPCAFNVPKAPTAAKVPERIRRQSKGPDVCVDRTDRRSSVMPAVFRVLLESGTAPISPEVVAHRTFLQNERMHVRTAILVIAKHLRSRFRTPSFDKLPREKVDTRCDEIIVEQVSCCGPSPFAFGPSKMHEKVGTQGEDLYERSRPAVLQANAYYPARILVKKWIAAERLVNGKVHAATWFEDAQIFGERSMRILNVVDYAVGNNHVGNFVGQRELQVVRDSTGAAISAPSEPERNAASVDADAAEAAPGEKAKDSSRTAANIEDERP